eukprot:TRINITY_DN8261_c0_g1_i1.p1 TRINITY_DN8261_c0_g1~~TRINITY_DN8261_c0_g1_i1.p1  ORF type:complete len:110 (+),score=24.19 TRINITY_DN8261_c0_g1_i1:35-364(+)
MSDIGHALEDFDNKTDGGVIINPPSSLRSYRVTVTRVLPRLYAEADGTWAIVIGTKQQYTPNRTFIYKCPTQEEQKRWTSILKTAAEQNKTIKLKVPKDQWSVYTVKIK